ncbi:MAG: hypothetical protein R2736_03570 [Solirubrobacterales bacterium]
MESRRTPLWVGAALLLVALNLRLPLAGVGPVIDDLRATLGLSNAAAGLLTTLPVLCFRRGGRRRARRHASSGAEGRHAGHRGDDRRYRDPARAAGGAVLPGHAAARRGDRGATSSSQS